MRGTNANGFASQWNLGFKVLVTGTVGMKVSFMTDIPFD